MARKPEPESLRTALKQKLGNNIADGMATSMLAALESTKTEWFECQHCHKKNPLVLPNAFERAKACQMVLEQLEGRVGTHREAPSQAKSKVGDLSELSDEQLLALLEEGDTNEQDDR